MRTSTQSVRIDAGPGQVFEFVSDLARLPRWAIGFAKDIRRENGDWIVTTGNGDEVSVRVEADAALGVVDYFMSPAPGEELPARTRVLPNEDGAEYVFTMFQPPGMPDATFDAQIAELARELTVLKAYAESACPL
jgi:polyketide cyclase/dehydrase/lipid transport protein